MKTFLNTLAVLFLLIAICGIIYSYTINIILGVMLTLGLIFLINESVPHKNISQHNRQNSLKQKHR